MSEQTNGLNFDAPKHNHNGAVAKEYESRFRILERLNREWHSGICLKGVDENKIKQYYPANNAAAHILAVNDFLRINRDVINAEPTEKAEYVQLTGRITRAAVDCASVSQAVTDGVASGSINNIIKDGKPTAIALDFGAVFIGGEEYRKGFMFRMDMIKKSNEKWKPGEYVWNCDLALLGKERDDDFHRGQIQAVNQFIRNNGALLKLNDKNAAQCFTESAGFNIAASGGFASRLVMVDVNPAIKVPAMQWLVVRMDTKEKTAAFVAAFFDKAAAINYVNSHADRQYFSFGVGTAAEIEKSLNGYTFEH